MLSDAQRDHLGGAVRMMQIIGGTLAAGVLFFLVVAMIIQPDEGPGRPILTYIAVALAVFAIGGSIVVVNQVTARAVRSIANYTFHSAGTQGGTTSDEVGDVRGLTAAYQVGLIGAAATLEGAAFFSLIAYINEGQVLALAMALVLLVLILVRIPTAMRLEHWVSAQLETVEQMRAQRG